jgi:hypothetical protein
MPNVTFLSFIENVVMLSVIMLSGSTLNVVLHAECHYAECCGAVPR